MIRYYARIDGLITELAERQPACWINIAPPVTQEEIEQLSEELCVPLDFFSDPLDIDERSRYERDEDARLIIINTAVLNERDGENEAIYLTIPIGIILVPDYIITITSAENPVLDLFLENKVRNADPADERQFVLRLLEENVYRFLSCLKKLNLRRNLIEQELYYSSRNQELKQLLSIQKSLVYFVNSLSANELLKMKVKRTDFLGIQGNEDKVELFEDIIIDNSQALEMANVYTNIIGGTMEAYAGIISNNLNIVIQRLTLITIILMVPTLVASIFGMNVPSGLENSPTAIYYIIVISIIFSLLLAWFFRRKRLF
ncbi:MAG: magnesium transporter CorA family protein [Saprospiraceae bacterium]|nr:magnesium transporter CorA family protein [Saprospiraceae bacterium]